MKTTAKLQFSPGFKRLLLILGLLNGVLGVRQIVSSLAAPAVYQKDFLSPYLMAKAISHGVNPYLPLHELASVWLSHANYERFKHPTPHPPLVGLFSVPLGFLSYETAATIWLLLELLCLTAALAYFVRWWGAPLKASTLACLLLVALGWLPVIEDLWFGQFGACLLLLLLGAWHALRNDKQIWGGVMLGGLIALKLTAWPVVIYLMLRRQWRSVFSAGAIVLLAHLLAVAVMGWQPVKDCYVSAGPQVAALYRSFEFNYSAWTVGQRVFAGIGDQVWIPPLWPSGALASLCMLVVPVALLLTGLTMALRAASFDTAFSFLVGVGILVNPVAWPHYLLWVSIPLAVMARQLWLNGWPRRMSYFAFGCLLAMTSATAIYGLAVNWLLAQTAPRGTLVVPFAVGTLTFVPALALLALLAGLWRLERAAFPLTASRLTEHVTGFSDAQVANAR